MERFAECLSTDSLIYPKHFMRGIKIKKTQKQPPHINRKLPPQGQSDEAVVVVPVEGNEMRH